MQFGTLVCVAFSLTTAVLGQTVQITTAAAASGTQGQIKDETKTPALEAATTALPGKKMGPLTKDIKPKNRLPFNFMPTRNLFDFRRMQKTKDIKESESAGKKKPMTKEEYMKWGPKTRFSQQKGMPLGPMTRPAGPIRVPPRFPFMMSREEVLWSLVQEFIAKLRSSRAASVLAPPNGMRTFSGQFFYNGYEMQYQRPFMMQPRMTMDQRPMFGKQRIVPLMMKRKESPKMTKKVETNEAGLPKMHLPAVQPAMKEDAVAMPIPVNGQVNEAKKP